MHVLCVCFACVCLCHVGLFSDKEERSKYIDGTIQMLESINMTFKLADCLCLHALLCVQMCVKSQVCTQVVLTLTD